jgi:hypothetical protein
MRFSEKGLGNISRIGEMRQIAGVFAQLEKARLVGKLKAGRDRKRATGTKVEGRKSYAEIDARVHNGQMISLAKKLRRKSPRADVDSCG